MSEHTPSHDGLPYTVLSCCISMDGYISGTSADRLMLSNAADFDRADAVRASCDAVLVGARTISADNPRLLVHSPNRIAARVAAGRAPHPLKATVTSTGVLDPTAAFFTTAGERVVYCASRCVRRARVGVGAAATTVDAGDPVRMRTVARDLYDRGVRRLLVEGGSVVHTQFLVEDVADELQLAVAPVFVGDRRARRFVGDGAFPWRPGRRGRLIGVQQVGDVAVMTYALSHRFSSADQDRGRP